MSRIIFPRISWYENRQAGHYIPASIGGLHAFKAFALVVVSVLSMMVALLISLPV